MQKVLYYNISTMKKSIYIIITLLLFVLSASAQVAGGAIKRPSKSQNASKVAPKPPKKQSTIQNPNNRTNKTQRPRGSVDNSQTKSPVNQEQKILNQEKDEALTGYANGHAWVDLGLPSGTLWATCNIGANSPEEYGDYFAWGEIKPKANYNWETYKWCKASSNSMTKYCTNSRCGIVDNKMKLAPEDDAAYINWGKGWHMPSMEQCQELINSSYTTTKWTTQNDINGLKITSKTNNNSIFLPAAGNHYVTTLNYADTYGYYWSCTLYSNISSNVMYLYFGNNYVYVSDGYRYNGRSVRPVTKRKRD